MGAIQWEREIETGKERSTSGYPPSSLIAVLSGEGTEEGTECGLKSEKMLLSFSSSISHLILSSNTLRSEIDTFVLRNLELRKKVCEFWRDS